MTIRTLTCLSLLLCLIFPVQASLQKRDHLTPQEVDLIKEARIFDEAITNIDDVSSRDERNPLIPKALRKLAQSVTSIMEQLKPLRSEAKSEAEIASLELLNEDAQSILTAASKLPPEVLDKKAKKNEKK